LNFPADGNLWGNLGKRRSWWHTPTRHRTAGSHSSSHGDDDFGVEVWVAGTSGGDRGKRRMVPCASPPLAFVPLRRLVKRRPSPRPGASAARDHAARGSARTNQDLCVFPGAPGSRKPNEWVKVCRGGVSPRSRHHRSRGLGRSFGGGHGPARRSAFGSFAHESRVAVPVRGVSVLQQAEGLL